MCYSARSATLARLKYALLRGDLLQAEEIQRQLEEMDLFNSPKYHVSAFAHPRLLVFTNEAPLTPRAFSWGLIPYWTKSRQDAQKINKQTLNARGETIFEKPAFRGPAKNKRCLVYLDAFYEHHHQGGKTFPFRIKMKDDTPMAVAGLWDEWVDKETGEVINTVTIVTTSGNGLLSKIHNNTKAEMGPRMPLILTREKQDEWLRPVKAEADKKHIQSLIRPLDEGLLTAHTVARINGKDAIGNTPDVEQHVIYDELLLQLEGL